MKLNAQVIEKMRSVNLDAVDKETLVDASGFVLIIRCRWKSELLVCWNS